MSFCSINIFSAISLTSLNVSAPDVRFCRFTSSSSSSKRLHISLIYGNSLTYTASDASSSAYCCKPPVHARIALSGADAFPGLKADKTATQFARGKIFSYNASLASTSSGENTVEAKSGSGSVSRKEKSFTAAAFFCHLHDASLFASLHSASALEAISMREPSPLSFTIFFHASEIIDFCVSRERVNRPLSVAREV